jgi:hypothetical protein
MLPGAAVIPPLSRIDRDFTPNDVIGKQGPFVFGQ